MSKAAAKKQCFVVGPIGDDDSDDRIHADWLLEDIIQPVFEEHFKEFDVRRADTISNPGQITTQVITALLESELVIADLTTLNPNAFYEIGIRHMVQKPIIHMHLDGQRIPFDIAPFRSIKFSRKRPRDIKDARAALLQFVEQAIDPDHHVDNPVTFSRGKIEFDKTATPADRVIIEEIDAINMRLDRMDGTSFYGVMVPPVGEDQDRYTVKSRNTSPDKDVQTAVKQVLRGLVEFDLRPLGRTEATLLLPRHPGNKVIIDMLEDAIGEDFMIVRHQPPFSQGSLKL